MYLSKIKKILPFSSFLFKTPIPIQKRESQLTFSSLPFSFLLIKWRKKMIQLSTLQSARSLYITEKGIIFNHRRSTSITNNLM